jgi:hypothetical protein
LSDRRKSIGSGEGSMMKKWKSKCRPAVRLLPRLTASSPTFGAPATLTDVHWYPINSRGILGLVVLTINDQEDLKCQVCQRQDGAIVLKAWGLHRK